MQTPGVQSLFDFTGKTVLVTGASGGIGADIARRFSEAGANIALHYRSGAKAADSLATELIKKGTNAHVFQADLTDAKSVTTMMDTVCAHFTTIDVLVNNAGIFPSVPLADMNLNEWKAMMAANTDSVFLCTQKAAEKMKESGSGAIINIASISGLNAGAAHAHYNSSKAAVIMFGQSAAQELAPYGIRVNNVSPGLVSRPGIKEAWPEGVNRWLKKTPLGRMAEPDDVADACLFLASPAARFITGINLPVEGGVLSTPIY